MAVFVYLLFSLLLLIIHASATVRVTRSTPEQRQFIAWLEDFLETRPRVATDKEETTDADDEMSGSDRDYCRKYAKNNRRYCENPNGSEKLGVLRHFCLMYAHRCPSEERQATPEPLITTSFRPAADVIQTYKQAIITRSEKLRYCAKYRDNYSYYCSGEYSQVFWAFCHSYSKHC